ncbi:MAG: hypothetical protein ABIK37_01380 [candidate division WOR-3 bacterium]
MDKSLDACGWMMGEVEAVGQRRSCPWASDTSSDPKAERLQAFAGSRRT